MLLKIEFEALPESICPRIIARLHAVWTIQGAPALMTTHTQFPFPLAALPCSLGTAYASPLPHSSIVDHNLAERHSDGAISSYSV